MLATSRLKLDQLAEFSREFRIALTKHMLALAPEDLLPGVSAVFY